MAGNNLPFPPGASVVAYLRDSGGEEQDLSIAQQEASLRAWCLSSGLVLSRVFTDAARPGSSVIKRNAFLEMISHFHEPSCPDKGVVVWTFSRFARNQNDAQYYKSDLRRRGFIVYSINDKIPDTPEGRVFEVLIDYTSEKYNENLAIDIKRGLHHMVSEYGAVPGHPPPGFLRETRTIGNRRDGKPHTISRWVADPDKAPLIRLAFQMRAGGSTIREIHDQVHLLKTKSMYGYFFRNRLYIGELVYAGQAYPNYAEPIVDKITWDQVQAINQHHKQNNHPLKGENSPTHPRRVGGSFLLSGLIYCNRCGAIMSGQIVKFGGKKRNDYYLCTGSKSRMTCDALAVPRLAIEKAVIDQISEYILNPQLMVNKEDKRTARLAARLEEQRAEAKAIEQNIATLKRRITNLINQVAEDPDAPRSIIASIKEMEKDLSLQQGNLGRLTSIKLNADVRAQTSVEIHQLSEKMIEVMASDDPLKKRTFIKLLVNRVTAEINVEGKSAFVRGMTYFYDDTDPDEDPPRSEGVKKNDPYAYGLTPSRDTVYTYKNPLFIADFLFFTNKSQIIAGYNHQNK